MAWSAVHKLNRPKIFSTHKNPCLQTQNGKNSHSDPRGGDCSRGNGDEFRSTWKKVESEGIVVGVRGSLNRVFLTRQKFAYVFNSVYSLLLICWMIVSPLALNKKTFPKVLTVIDSSIASSSSVFAVHAFFQFHRLPPGHRYRITSTTFGNRGRQSPASWLPELGDGSRSCCCIGLETAGEGKEDAKIEGAVRFAIGVKKEVVARKSILRLGVQMWVCPMGWTRCHVEGFVAGATKTDMLVYYSVSGCYILKPWSYSILLYFCSCHHLTVSQSGSLKSRKLKELGVQNSYFPMFVSAKVLKREKDHIEGFSGQQKKENLLILLKYRYNSILNYSGLEGWLGNLFRIVTAAGLEQMWWYHPWWRCKYTWHGDDFPVEVEAEVEVEVALDWTITPVTCTLHSQHCPI